MRKSINLILLLLCLVSMLYAQQPLMEKKVSLQYRETTIGDILKDLNKRYNISFSYSSSIVPDKKKITISIKNVMLKDALYDLFKDTDIAFQTVGEQIVLKRGIKKNTSSLVKYRVENSSKPPILFNPAINAEDLLASADKDLIIDTMPNDEYGFEEATIEEITLPEGKANQPDNSKKDLKRKYKGERKLLKARLYILKDSIRRAGGRGLEKMELKYNYVVQKLKREFHEAKERSKSSQPNKVLDSSNTKKDTLVVESTVKADTSVSTPSKEYLYRTFQVTFIPPLGSNGMDAGRTVNNFSFNILGGHAAGLEGLELASIANVEKDYATGLQMAGLANVVKNKMRGIQLSGFANVCGDTVKALQAAGFCNVVGASTEGLQVSGFCNVTQGSTRGLQGTGFVNVNKDSLTGFQVAGFGNINGGDVRGIQASGFINTAKKVKGMQLGFINVADTIDGLPVGFISFVRKGGYRRLDVFGTEALYANVAFKIGVKPFYNIFQVGGQLNGSNLRLAYGYGVGSEVALGEKLVFNAENTTMQVWEPDMKQFDLNVLNRLSTTLGVQLGKRTALYAGPTVNVMVSRYQDPSRTELGSGLAPYTIYNKTLDNRNGPDVNLKIWIGFQAGIRF